MTRAVKDAAVLLDVLVGHDPEDPFTAAATLARGVGSYADGLGEGALGGARVGVLRDAFGAEGDPDSGQVQRVVGEAVEAMRGAGAAIVDPVSVPRVQHVVGVARLSLSQSRYGMGNILAKRPGTNAVGRLYDSKRFPARVDLF